MKVLSRKQYEEYKRKQIREMYLSLISTELICIQPLEIPTGLIYYMDYKTNNKNKKQNK